MKQRERKDRVHGEQLDNSKGTKRDKLAKGTPFQKKKNWLTMCRGDPRKDGRGIRDEKIKKSPKMYQKGLGYLPN